MRPNARRQTKTIRSLSEIPEAMTEHEEAEYWGTHSLGPELLSTMEPFAVPDLPPVHPR